MYELVPVCLLIIFIKAFMLSTYCNERILNLSQSDKSKPVLGGCVFNGSTSVMFVCWLKNYLILDIYFKIKLF